MAIRMENDSIESIDDKKEVKDAKNEELKSQLIISSKITLKINLFKSKLVLSWIEDFKENIDSYEDIIKNEIKWEIKLFKVIISFQSSLLKI